MDYSKLGKQEGDWQRGGKEELADVFNDKIPVLSPALGFSRDLALVTVSLRERTKGNRLNIQPYLVTSTRELIRLKDQQILTIHDQEIALRVIPEGSEFLMRWRYSDIQRFLKGEEVQPGEVFAPCMTYSRPTWISGRRWRAAF